MGSFSTKSTNTWSIFLWFLAMYILHLLTKIFKQKTSSKCIHDFNKSQYSKKYFFPSSQYLPMEAIEKKTFISEQK